MQHFIVADGPRKWATSVLRITDAVSLFIIRLIHCLRQIKEK